MNKTNKKIIIYLILLVVSAICIGLFFILSDPEDIKRTFEYNSNKKYGIAVIAMKTLVRYLMLIVGILIPVYLGYLHFFKKE